jgi:hypothetical protein
MLAAFGFEAPGVVTGDRYFADHAVNLATLR